MGETLEEALAHYGIKGMKWGVRRKDPGGSSKAANSSKAFDPSDPPSKKLESASRLSGSSSSGSSHRQSDDDIVYQALRNKARKEGIRTLSNEEVRVLTTRHELMTKYAKLNPPPPKNPVVEFFVNDLLIGTGKKTVLAVAQEVVTKRAVKRMAPGT